MSEPIAGRYRSVAPLPAIGGVKRELAVDQVADHRVAVAKLKAGERVDAVDRHLRALQAVRHSSLAPVLDVALLADGKIAHVEAQADGPLLSGSVLMPQASALLVAADIADALAALHSVGQAHGGLVPDAVVLDTSGRPVVLGAGLAAAKAIADGASAPVASDDMRALGAILYLLVAGREPAQPPASPMTFAPGISPALNGLILALLSDDARRPPPPAVATANRLRAMAGMDLPADLAPAPLPQAPLPTTPRRGISDAGLAAIVGAIALLAVVLAVAAINGGAIGDDDTTAETGTGVPTFTLPDPSSLTLTVTGDALPLPGVVTDTVVTDTVPTETFEVFTDTTATVPAVTDTAPLSTDAGITTISAG
jgi:serine/threonine protein kinase